MMFICPVCGEPLECGEKEYRCSAGHCHDISKAGAVNLLMSQKSSKKRHGDDRLMVRARRDFLDGGYYSCLRDRICDVIVRYQPHSVLDVGCGEGYYTKAVCDFAGDAEVFGIDISKAAVEYASKRCPNARFAVASAFALPIADSCAQCVTSIFAPLSLQELSRVLCPGGILIRVIPLEKHLMGLKKLIYESVYENPPESTDLPGFSLLEKTELCDKMTVVGKNVQNLFMMTPYYYKTSASDQAKLASVNELKTEIEFAVLVYSKK